MVKAVLAMSESTYRALCYRGAGCLSGVLPVLSLNCLSSVRTYLPGTVIQWCRLFKRCPNLPAGHCATVVQAVFKKSIVRTYLPGTVLQGCRLYKRCWNLPAGHCATVAQAV